MRHDRSPIWIGIPDLLLCTFSATAPTKAKVEGLNAKAELLIIADWPVDSDVDLCVVGPSKEPVFYGSREVGCEALDRGRLRNSTSLITIADGSVVRADSKKETTTLRCIDPAHWHVGLSHYSDRRLASGAKSIPVRLKVTGLNPQTTILFAGDPTLNHNERPVNVGSLDTDRAGEITLRDLPIEPITDAHKGAKP